MNIIFLLPQLVYGRHGGFVGGYVNSVLNLMAEMQFAASLTLVAGIYESDPQGEEELRELLRQTQLELLPMKSRPSSTAYFCEFLWKSRGACRRGRKDVDFVYGHSGHPGHGLATWLGAQSAQAIGVHSLYCPVSEEFQHRRVGLATRMMVGQAFRRVPHHVAISENVRDSVRRVTQKTTDPCVLLPVIPDAFGCAPSEAGGVGGEKRSLVAGFVGHHKSEKGFDLALAAVKAAVERGEDISLLALTSGAESQGGAAKEVASMIAEFGLENRVRLVHGIKNIRDFYAEVDLMLIPFRGTRGPSDYPMVLLEAMSVGTPVVCTAVGAMPEVVKDGDNGFLSPSPNAEEFTSALMRAISGIRSGADGISASAVSTAKRFRASVVAKATLAHLTYLKGQQNDNER